MPFLFQYLIKLSISLGVLYTFYYFVLRPLTFYQWNRFYLVCYSLLSFVIPFINVTDWLSGKSFNESYLINSIPAVDKLTSKSFHISRGTDVLSFMLTWNFAGLLFLVGSLVMLTRLLYQYISLRTMKRKAILLKTGDFEFYDVNGPIAPFSFANSIFINSRLHSEEEFHKILEHEFVHVKQKHTIDIVVAELLCVLNWFNPFAWLIRKSIRQNLEFIADNNVLQGGIDSRQYQYLLLKVMGLPQYSITNNFSFSSLKKRIAMMNKMKTARVHLVKFLFVLPLLTVMLLAFRDRIAFNKDALTLTYAGIIISSSDNQPLKNVTLKELNTNREIRTDANGFFTFSVPAKGDHTSLKINVIKDGTLHKKLTVAWMPFAPHMSESFIGLISLDDHSTVSDKCDNCFAYQNQLTDKNGLFVKEVTYELVHKNLTDYLQARNDINILNQTSNPITKIANRLYISSANNGKSQLSATGFLTILVNQFKLLPLFYKNGVVSSMENINATTKRFELKQVEHLNAEKAAKKYGVNNEVIDITTYSGMGSDTIPRVYVLVAAPVDTTIGKITKVFITPVPAVSAVRSKSAITQPVKASSAVADEALTEVRIEPVTSINVAKPGVSNVTIRKATATRKAEPVTNGSIIISPVEALAVDTLSPKILLRSVNPGNSPLYVVDGKVTGEDEFQKIDPKDIEAINVMKGVSALSAFGDKGKDGVIEVTTKIKKVEDISVSAESGVKLEGLTNLKGVLIVIDGKEVDQTKLNQIPPNEIKSITVLKDKESIAIYNEKARNGVIIIETKKKGK